MRFFTISLTILVLVTFTACTNTTEPRTDNSAPNVPTLMAGDVHNFLPGKSAPLHIGDDAGGIEDIDDFKSENPDTHFVGSNYTWRFKISGNVESTALRVSIFSLEPTGQYDCPTTIRVNGEVVFDLRNASPTGQAITTPARINIESSHFHSGTNRLAIHEERCAGGSWKNDSIIVPKGNNDAGVELTIN